MNIFKAFLFLGLTCIGLGCATRAVQTEVLLKDTGSLKSFHLIQTVRFIDQTAGYCGPSTLAMAMNSAGHKINVEDVAKQVYTPGFRGSLQADLVGASRRQGLMAVQIRDLPNLLAEVSADHPVIIFENLGLTWAPNWHYALVIGYDLKSEEIIMISGHDQFYNWDLRKFERSWMLGDYWALVVLPPGELAVSAGEVAQVTAAVGLEMANHPEAAQKSYASIVRRWPKSLIALIGLANIAYESGDIKLANQYLRQAVKAHPESTAAKHNLAVVSASVSQ